MKTLILSTLLPPGVLLLLLGVLMVMIWREVSKRRVMVMAVVCLLVGWTFSTTAFGRFLGVGLVSQIQGRQIMDPSQADLIVLLTGGMTYGGPIGWLPKAESYRRAAVAFELQDRLGTRVPVLISGGKTAGVQYPSEADVVQRFLDRRRAEITPVILEEASSNTYESALQVAALAQKRGAKDIFLVTSELHMLRALAVYRGRGMDVVPFPVLTLPRGNLRGRDYLPTWEGMSLTATALYEILGLLDYMLTGKMSWNDMMYEGGR